MLLIVKKLKLIRHFSGKHTHPNNLNLNFNHQNLTSKLHFIVQIFKRCFWLNSTSREVIKVIFNDGYLKNSQEGKLNHHALTTESENFTVPQLWGEQLDFKFLSYAGLSMSCQNKCHDIPPMTTPIHAHEEILNLVLWHGFVR